MVHGKTQSLQTQMVCVDPESNTDVYGASVPPLYQTTTFKQELLEDEGQEYDYTRSGNPTRTLLQKQVGKLYGVDAKQVFAVSSGMTALDVILRSVLRGKNDADESGQVRKPTIIAGDDLYGGTQRLLSYLHESGYAKVTHVNTADTDEFTEAFRSVASSDGNVDCVLLESPTNPLMKVADLPRLVGFIKGVDPDSIVVVDNTMVSGINCNPLLFGADYIYESGTKYLNGHHDIMAGVIATNSPKAAEEIYFIVNATGAGLSPMDSWLLIRGLKTLSVRMYQQQHNAMVLAHWLENSCGFRETPKNKSLRTRFVGLKSHPQFELHKSFNSGPGAVLSIETGDIELSTKIVSSKKLKTWNVTVSFGCVNSLISMPCKMSHASIDPELRKERNFPEDLVRLCCGIEDIADLQQGLLGALEDAGVIELKESKDTITALSNAFTKKNSDAVIVNKLNGLTGKLNLYTTGLGNRNIYDDYFSRFSANYRLGESIIKSFRRDNVAKL